MTDQPSLEALLASTHLTDAVFRFPATWKWALEELTDEREQRAAVQALFYAANEAKARDEA